VRIRNKSHCSSIIAYLDKHIQAHGEPSFACNLRLAVEGNIGAGARAGAAGAWDSGLIQGPCQRWARCNRRGRAHRPWPALAYQHTHTTTTPHPSPLTPRHPLTTHHHPAGKSTFLQYITSESPTIQQRLHLVPEPVDDWQRVCAPGASPSAQTFNILQVRACGPQQRGVAG
jgi:hypothetical protein